MSLSKMIQRETGEGQVKDGNLRARSVDISSRVRAGRPAHALRVGTGQEGRYADGRRC